MLSDNDVIQLALKVMQAQPIAVFATADAQGQPFMRHMVGVTNNDDGRFIYSFTGQETRKIEHIRANPKVAWFYSSKDRPEVVALRGVAKVYPTADLPASVWEQLIELAEPYAEALRSEHHYAFQAIETRVESIEVLSPDLDPVAPRTVTL